MSRAGVKERCVRAAQGLFWLSGCRVVAGKVYGREKGKSENKMKGQKKMKGKRRRNGREKEKEMSGKKKEQNDT